MENIEQTNARLNDALARLDGIRNSVIGSSKWSRDRLLAVIEKLNRIADKAQTMEAAERYNPKVLKIKSRNSIACLVKILNSRLEDEGGRAILNAAIPMTRQVLNTVSVYMNRVRKYQRESKRVLRETVQGTAADMVTAGKEASSSIMSQTAAFKAFCSGISLQTVELLLNVDKDTNEAQAGIDSMMASMNGMTEVASEEASALLNYAAEGATVILKQFLDETSETSEKSAWEKIDEVADSSCGLIATAATLFAKNMIGDRGVVMALEMFGDVVNLSAVGEYDEKATAIGGKFGEATEDALAHPDRAVNIAANLILNEMYAGFADVEQKMHDCSTAIATESSGQLRVSVSHTLNQVSLLCNRFLESSERVQTAIQDAAKGFVASMCNVVQNILMAVTSRSATKGPVARSLFGDLWGKVKGFVSSDDSDSSGDGSQESGSILSGIVGKLKDVAQNVADKAKSAVNAVKDTIKKGVDKLLGKEADKDDENADEDEDEEDELSDAEKLLGENFNKKKAAKTGSPLADDADWKNDPDIQKWLNQDNDDFLNDDDDDTDDDSDPNSDDGNPDGDDGSPEDYYDDEDPWNDDPDDTDMGNDGYPEDGYPEGSDYPDGQYPEDSTNPAKDMGTGTVMMPEGPLGGQPIPPPGYNPSDGSPPTSWNPDLGDQPDPTSDNSSTTPISASSPPPDKGIHPTSARTRQMGWKGYEAEFTVGAEMLIHDGDQQLLNPYGRPNGDWTLYSFRPCDVNKKPWFPQISITPASFEAIASMDTMLDSIPYVVVKEYFFKNTADTMINFVKKIAGLAKEAFQKPKPVDNADEVSAQGSQDTGSEGGSFLDKVKEKFKTLTLKQAAIELPYVLYVGLRRKVYGNTYIFPYIVKSSTCINEASNNSEWNEKGGFVQGLKDLLQGAVSMVGDFAMGIIGSQAQTANLFPAPTWKNTGQDGVSFSFDLILINDHVIKTRNNYMCVNTIIHNNRSMQKTILAFPGALYEVWLPTGQRHLMCTGDFKLFPLGLNRATPNGFFGGDARTGQAANFQIGVNNGDAAQLENPKGKGHVDGQEVIPDAYKLQITFKSCLANNMNTAVFQYYVEMTGYDNYKNENDAGGKEKKDTLPGQVSDWAAGISGSDYQADKPQAANTEGGTPAGGASKDITRKTLAREFAKAVNELVDGYDRPDEESPLGATQLGNGSTLYERFEEATYNKKLEKLKASFGDQAINADSVIATVRKTQKIIRETNEFLRKLYNANRNNLWYRPIETDEIYTTMEPDYRQTLKKRYGDKLKQIRQLDQQISAQSRSLESLDARLTETKTLTERNPILEERVQVMEKLGSLKKKRDAAADESIQIDTQLLQSAFDEHDKVVSVKKNSMTFRIFKQVWNEKIMNAYEKEKLQYMTSVEKTRYFNEKIRELKKYDTYGILNHPDWFFRVAVLDFIVSEMHGLVYWFKNCAFDDFDTIYKIMRKLRLLHLDVDSVRAAGKFDINRTNLFYLSDDDLAEFTKVDGMLTGNTLYQLFQSQVRINIVSEEVEGETSNEEEKPEEKDKELVREQKSELETENQRKVRQDIVTRFWGSETELTRDAYQKVNLDDRSRVTGIEVIDDDGATHLEDFDSIKVLKNEIIELKLTAPTSMRLRSLLSGFTNLVNVMKEALVIQKMNDMKLASQKEMNLKQDCVNAEVLVLDS